MRLLILLTMFFAFCLYASVPFYKTPDWESQDKTFCGTGLALADINGDGYLDMIVGNGNDMVVQRVTMYINDGSGNLPDKANWASADSNYQGHISVGDINGDGWLDVVVSVFLGLDRFNTPGWVKVYYNDNGVLSTTPGWRSADSFFDFSCSLGDMNGDGLLDLAVACGEGYYHHNDKHYNRVYLNTGNGFSTTPAWMDADGDNTMDVTWADVNKDGYLDLIAVNEGAADKIYFNNNGILSTTPGWMSTETNRGANSVFCNDFNNDGFIDLAVSDNSQIQAGGFFKLFLNNNGSMGTEAFWKSDSSGYGSAVILADIDNDGRPDYLGGRWWGEVEVFLNNGTSLPGEPDYKSNTSSVVEAYYLGDVNRDGLIGTKETYVMGNPANRIIYLKHIFWHKINQITRNGSNFTRFCSMPDQGWVSLSKDVVSGDTIVVDYTYSDKLDLAVSNWDYYENGPGNYLFLNHTTGFTKKSSSKHVPQAISMNIYPNPASYSCFIRFTSPVAVNNGQIRIYDLSGRSIRIFNLGYTLGQQEIFFDMRDKRGMSLSSGIYFVELDLNGQRTVRRLIRR